MDLSKNPIELNKKEKSSKYNLINAINYKDIKILFLISSLCID